MFTCCHPALSLEARVALTLRTLAGLTTAEIARAFLASEPTMAKRLVRAKHKIQHAGIPYRVPPAHLLPERTPGVLGVLYLLFNEGYSASAGADLVRQNLSAEAIRLARVLARLMPDEPEAVGLLALMLLHDARRAARRGRRRGPGHAGGPGPRAVGPAPRSARAPLSSRRRCAAAGRVRTRSRRPSPPATRPPRTRGRTDWAEIAAAVRAARGSSLPSPVVELNRAVAVAMAQGLAAGLELVAALEASGALAGYHLLPATRADLLRRLGRPAEAAAATGRP